MAHQFYFNPYILDNLPAPANGFDVVQDVSEPRLRMYITSRGVKTFFVRKRVNGRDRRIIIGKYPDMDIEDARLAVPEILTTASARPRTRRRKVTFREMIDLYMKNRVRRGEDSRTKLQRAINRHLAELFDVELSKISAADISAVISKIPGPAMAARMQELISSIFNHAMDTGYVTVNPVVGLPRVAQNRRVRPLNKSGMHRLIAAIEQEPSQTMRAAFLMMIYGFAPKSKVLSMAWQDLDFNHYMWGDMPLSDLAVVLLRDLPQDGHWVFPGRGGGLHLMDPRVAWRRIAAAAGIPNLTIDDVHKFVMRRLTWASDREDLRENMNALLDELLMSE